MPSAGGTGAVPDASGVPTGLTAVTTAAPAGSTDSSECVAGSEPGCGSDMTATGGAMNPCPAGTKPAARQSPAPEVSAYSKVWVQCCSWNPDPSGTSAGLADPDRRRPAGAGPRQREVERAGAIDREARQPPAQQRHRVRREPRPGLGRRSGVDGGVGQVRDQLGDRAGAGHDQHRQGPYAAEVGAGLPDLGQRPVRRDPDPGSPVRSELAVELRAVPGRGGGEDGGGERVASGPPTAMRVSGRLESTASAPYRLPVSSAVVEVTPARTSATTRSRTSSRRRGRLTTSATPTAVAAVPGHDPRGRAHPQPGVRRVVQRPRVLGRVHVHDPEPAPDHRGPDLADRQAAAHAVGQRSRSSRSWPAGRSRVSQSTRDSPDQTVSTCSYRTSSSAPETTRRWPAGLVSARTRARPLPARDRGGPVGSRCQGPSPNVGCCGYSS